MDGACDQILARPGLASEQYGGVGLRDLLGHVEDALHRRTVADDALEGVAPFDLAAEIDVLRSQLLVVDEILSLGRQVLVQAGLDGKIPSGLVLTGGCSALEGLVDLAEEIFETPVRPGVATNIGGLQDVVRSPMYATGVGLVLFGASQARGGLSTRFRIRDGSIFGRVKQRMRDWFYGEFA